MAVRQFRLLACSLAVLLVMSLLPVALVSAQEPVLLRVLNYFDATSPGAQRDLDEVWRVFEE